MDQTRFTTVGSRINFAKTLVGDGTIKSLSEATGISIPQISRYTGNITDPPLGRAVTIANAARLNLLWLATGEGEVFQKSDS